MVGILFQLYLGEDAEVSIKRYNEFCELVNLYGLSGKQVADIFSGYLGNRIFDRGLLDYARSTYQDFTHTAADEERDSICDTEGNVLAAIIDYSDGVSKVCLARDAKFFTNKKTTQLRFFKIILQKFDDLSFDDSDRLWITRDDKENLLDDFTLYKDAESSQKLMSSAGCLFDYKMLETLDY